MPGWVNTAFNEYAGRLRAPMQLKLTEIPMTRRGKGVDTGRAKAEEGKRSLQAVPDSANVIALDERGRSWSTRDLAQQMRQWQQDGDPVALMVGGPDGLAPAVLERARSRWSLSALTLPHAMVRVVVAEQIYRASSLLNNHPYHRD
jgi:23S rRNA (pseudouridine1915-N3)-methyltransferase